MGFSLFRQLFFSSFLKSYGDGRLFYKIFSYDNLRMKLPCFLCRNGRFRMHAVSKRRDRHDIVAEILETAKGGALKTYIMYRAKLSYAQINTYVPQLVEKGFLEDLTIVRNGRVKHVLKTTMQGKQLLQNLKLVDM